MKKTKLEIINVSKEYSDEFGFKIKLLQNISFEISPDRCTGIIAPKGSGKTSLLKIISGLENPTGGQIIAHRFMNIVFIPTQPSSFPWFTVMENLKFASKLEDEEQLKDIVKIIGLDGYENHIPHNKSLGFRFRIALGRALANKADLIVLDEPFNEMDIVTKEEMYDLVRKIFTERKIPVLLGTTNITEAIFLSDKLHLMKKNPGEFIDEMDVNLPWQREIKLISDPSFNDLRVKIENIFKTKESYKSLNFYI